MTTGAALLEVSDLHAGYGAVKVLHGLDFTVTAGEVVVILGANGAGKTTTLRAVSGMIPGQGRATFEGRELLGRRCDQIAHSGVGHVPQGRGTIVDLTVEDNLRVGAYRRRDKDVAADIDGWYEAFPRLGQRRTQQAGSMSGGEQQMLAIARAMMARPKLVLLDEPSLGLAPIITQELFRKLSEISREQGVAMLIVEQNATLALGIAQRGYVLETGAIVASGTAAELSANDDVQRAYLGLQMALFFTQVMNGIGAGAVYASLAIALTLIFRTTGILNFAQGEMALYSTYLVWFFADKGLPVWIAILISVALSFLGGAAIERVVIRPVEKSSPLVIVIVTIGMFLAINSIVQVQFGSDAKQLARAYAAHTWRPGGVQISADTLVLVAVLILECVLLYLLLRRTKIGLAVRSVASNPESSQLLGIPVGRMLMLGWALAAGFGALAGALSVPASQPALTAASMESILIFAFAAAALGGFDSTIGAVVGGLIVGVAQSLTTQYIHALSDIVLVVPFGLILLVLLVRPQGLFGTQRVERV